MTIAVTNLRKRSGKTTCAVNLACELAKSNLQVEDRWRGVNRVVLVDADSNGGASKYWAGGRLPVSAERMPLDYSTNLGEWIEQIQAIAVDHVVIDVPSHPSGAVKEVMAISDLVVIPCSVGATDLGSTEGTLNLLREARLARPDNGPKCLLVPVGVNLNVAALTAMARRLFLFGEPVGPTLNRRATFAASRRAGQWIGDFAPHGAAHLDINLLAESVVHCRGNIVNDFSARTQCPGVAGKYQKATG